MRRFTVRLCGQALEWHKRYSGIPDSKVPMRQQSLWYEIYVYLFAKLSKEAGRNPPRDGAERTYRGKSLEGEFYSVHWYCEGTVLWVDHIACAGAPPHKSIDL